MRIYFLVDNLAGRNCRAEWGFSLFIEGKKNILFDFGASNLFLLNAQKLGIDLEKVDYLVLSHGHWDHGNGLEYIANKKLICHPEAFIRRYRDNEYIGLPINLAQAREKFDLILSSDPIKIDEEIVFLGQIPRRNDFEAKDTVFCKEDGSKDFVLDDTGLAFKTEKGLVIISGCAHAGICNTVDYAVKITGMNKVYAVLGGFHLKGKDQITNKTITYLQKLRVEKVMPSHCTQFPALVEFNKAFGNPQLYCGQILEL
ncbi:MAG: MBL fold metallo-hydrolase [Clostridia bacterium]|nr:MBL fold metallo-hydrolase [Clostridia bacterium]